MSSVTQREYVAAMREILAILFRENYCWGRCIGCDGNPGMSLDDLLAALEQSGSTQFNWDLDFLQQITRLGLRTGALRQYPRDYFFFNANMLFENALNYQFVGTIPNLCEPKLHRHMPFVIY